MMMNPVPTQSQRPANTRPKQPGSNLHPHSLPPPIFDPGNPRAYLESLRDSVETAALDTIDWYLKHKQPKAFGSRLLRFLAIVFTTLGGLVPLLNGADVEFPLMENSGYGYVYLAIAAGCIGMDRFFGLSSAWMRHLGTSMAMQKDLAGFQMDWALAWAELQDGQPNLDQQRALLELSRRFRLRIAERVEQETDIWIREFQDNINQQEKAANADLGADGPGGIAVTVINGECATEGLSVSVDGQLWGHHYGGHLVLGHIAAGTHTILIHGRVDGKDLEVAGSVTVVPGEVGKLTLELPLPQQD
jgi:hypothetical protein